LVAFNLRKNADLFTAPDAESIATPNALRQSDAGFRLLADTMPQMVWSTLPDGFHDYYNQRWYEFTGMPDGSTDGEAWNGMFHPDDQELAWSRWRHSLATGEPYEVEYRLRHRSGEYRWTIGRALPLRDTSGRIVRWIGTCTDIDDAKRQAEQTEILSRELSHRIKNIFAVINGLIGLSVRRNPQAASFADDLRRRIWALGRAHEFARPHSEESRTSIGESSLMGLMRELLRPYPALDEGRLTINGDDVPIDDRGATPLALIFHELATNAAKYGALSVAEGQVSLTSCREGNDLVIEWRERGGPPIQAEPERVGFGTKLVDMSVVQQLNGKIDRAWHHDGLRVTLRVQPERLVRGERAI
jgi:PAS domain S-box-containing protein